MNISDIIWGTVSFLVPLSILIVIIAITVILLRRRGDGHDAPGIGTIKRVYIYSFSYIGLQVATIGVITLLYTVLSATLNSKSLTEGNMPLAYGLTFTIVGTPLWLIFWRMAQMSVSKFQVETKVASRKAYIHLVLGVSAIAASISAIMCLRWVLGTTEFSALNISVVAVMGGIWAFHWVLERREGQSSDLALSIRRVYVHVLSLFGVVLLALGSGGILYQIMTATYDIIFRTSDILLSKSINLWGGTMQTSIAMLLVGATVWWWHWHRIARIDSKSSLRTVYLYLFAVLGGASTVVTSLSVLLFSILQWYFGNPTSTSARVHFDMLPGLIAAITIGGGLWIYHWAIVRQGATTSHREMVSARRVYGYLVSSVGLATLSGGLVTVFAVTIGLLFSRAITQTIDPDWWKNQFVLGITLLTVGVPVWGLYWRDMQRVAKHVGYEERASLSRRVFIFLIFGISVLMTLINLSIVLVTVFDAAIRTELSADLLWENRNNISILFTASAVGVYYWMVLREDRSIIAQSEDGITSPTYHPKELQLRKSITVLVSNQDLPLVHRLESRLGYSVYVWQRVKAQSPAFPVSDDYIMEKAHQIVAAESDQVLVVIDAEGIHVIPYCKT